MGAPDETVSARHGTYVDWFLRLFARHDVQVEPFDATTGQLPHGHRDFDGVVLTGSPASVTEPENWMEAGVEWIRDAHVTGQPLLGVCFGHQLMAAAFGASVIRNPAGWQLGTRAIELGPRGRDDALFTGLPDRFEVNFVHQDTAAADTISPLNGLHVLASSPRARVAAIAAGPRMRGVQFHPEITRDINCALLERRRDEIMREHEARSAPPDGPDDQDSHPDQLLAGMRDTPGGEQVFHNFIEYFIKPGR